MPVRPLPTYGAPPNKMYEIDNPGIGGLVLTKEEYKLSPNQSPFMVNMMYRNGRFTKRYGQSLEYVAREAFYDAIVVNYYVSGDRYTGILYHDDDTIYYEPFPMSGDYMAVASNVPQKKGIFVLDGNDVLYFVEGHIYRFSGFEGTITCATDIFDVPTVLINCALDGSTADVADDANLLTSYFYATYHGDGTSQLVISDYIWEQIEPNNIMEIVDTVGGHTFLRPDATGNPKWAWKNNDINTKTIVFPLPLVTGVNNVRVRYDFNTNNFNATAKNEITGADHIIRFGAGKSTRYFVAKGDKIYYSYPYKATYFPENNFIDLSNDLGDITGMGIQYGRLVVFKQKSIYQIENFIQTTATTLVTEDVGLEGFKIDIVNDDIGCTAPGSLQLFHNNLIWFSAGHGVCMLVSTNNLDEQNVHIISENINHGNRYLEHGVLDLANEYMQSCVYENKYFLFATENDCFMWDGELSSYNTKYKGGANPEKLTWFYFTGIPVGTFVKNTDHPYYLSNDGESMMEFTDDLYDYTQDGTLPIRAVYMTPVMHFGAVEYLKNVLQFWVQLRTGVHTIIDAYYLTDRDTYAEQEDHSFILNNLPFWAGFRWNTFQWHISQWSDVFRRRLPLKKIKFISFGFEQNTIGMDMPISHIGIQYVINKLIR